MALLYNTSMKWKSANLVTLPRTGQGRTGPGVYGSLAVRIPPRKRKERRVLPFSRASWFLLPPCIRKKRGKEKYRSNFFFETKEGKREGRRQEEGRRQSGRHNNNKGLEHKPKERRKQASAR